MFDELKEPFDPTGMPAAEVLATGRPISASRRDVGRYPATRRFLALAFRSVWSVPLITGDVFGTLARSRMTDDEWTEANDPACENTTSHASSVEQRISQTTMHHARLC